MNLDKPVDQDTTRLPLEVVLVRHILRVRNRLVLEVAKIFEDFVCVLGNHKRVIHVLIVQVLDTGRELDGRVLSFDLLDRDFGLLSLDFFGCLGTFNLFRCGWLLVWEFVLVDGGLWLVGCHLSFVDGTSSIGNLSGSLGC